MPVFPDRLKRMISHFERLKDGRNQWDNHWQEISDHALARRDFTVGREPGRTRTARIYDSTSMDANNLLAAALHALLTNPSTRWFDLKFANEEANEDEDAILWLDDTKRRISNAFSRPGSGFTTNIAEVYKDITGFGSGVLMVTDSTMGPTFSSRPLAETYVDVDFTGRVGVVYRRFSMKAWQAVEQFGDRAVYAKKKVEKDVLAETEWLHLVRKRGDVLPGNIDSSGMEWESIYISMDDHKPASEGGFHENPYLVGRWAVDTGELYGRGPGNDSLPEQKMLNAMWRSYIRNLEKAADPPVLVDDDGVMPGSQLRITPSAQIVVRNDGSRAREPVRYLENRARLELEFQTIESRAKKVEKAYHSEIIQAFQDPRMTATQVLELARLAQRQLSPVLGRMQVEILEPMIERVYGIMSRKNLLLAPPSSIEGADLKIEYVSPVARAQKQSDAQAILDSFAAAAALAEVDPGVMDNVDLDAAIRTVFEGNGVPLKVLRTSSEVVKIRRVQAEAMQRDREMQQEQAAGETVAKLLPGIAKLQETVPAGSIQ